MGLKVNGYTSRGNNARSSFSGSLFERINSETKEFAQSIPFSKGSIVQRCQHGVTKVVPFIARDVFVGHYMPVGQFLVSAL